MTNFQRPLGGSFNSREAEPTPPSTPEPEAKPSEGAPQAVTYSGHSKPYPESRRGDQLLPSFSRFSESLTGELAADEAIRRGKITEALGLGETEKLATHREALAQAVKAGDMSEAEARALWSRQHPGVDPASLQERK